MKINYSYCRDVVSGEKIAINGLFKSSLNILTNFVKDLKIKPTNFKLKLEKDDVFGEYYILERNESRPFDNINLGLIVKSGILSGVFAKDNDNCSFLLESPDRKKGDIDFYRIENHEILSDDDEPEDPKLFRFEFIKIDNSNANEYYIEFIYNEEFEVEECQITINIEE